MRIYVDPEVRITYDGSDVTHMEAPIAASITDPNRLVVAAELGIPGRRMLAMPTQIYWSDDAGSQWHPTLPVESEGWDNAMAAGPHGALYFITHNFERGLALYTSKDGGVSWTHALVPGLAHGKPDPHGWDREYAVVDTHPKSPYFGRLYIAGEGMPRANEGSAQIVVSSADEGATFNKPAVACDPSTWAPRYRKLRRRITQEPGPAVATEVESIQAPVVLSDGSLAAAPPTGIHPDRLYSVWPFIDSKDLTALYVAYSDDRGKSWSKPRAVDLDARSPKGRVRQAGPMLAVNKDGVVGLAWFDARHATEDGYDIYFTASLDGGEHFLPSQRLTSQTSYPTAGPSGAAMVNDVKQSAAGESPVSTVVELMSPYVSRRAGGDQSTLVADAAGRFHALWSDARAGSAWQLYTRTVRVAPTVLSDAGSKQCLADSQFRVLFGETQWNPDTKQMTMPLRVQNLSTEILSRPISLELRSARPRGSTNVIAWYSAPAPFIDVSTGATLDTVRIEVPISADRPLFPQSATEEIRLTLSVPEPAKMFFNKTITVGCPKGDS